VAVAEVLRATRRRVPVPVPTAAVALAALAVTLEFIGYLTRVTGAPPAIAQPLSMDAPLSIARMFVAGLFAAAALAAGVGAGRQPGRRTWWTAVATVAAGIAMVKAGGTVHARVLHALAGDDPVRGLIVSVPMAVAVAAWLWWLSRHERRDRRRVLSCLVAYATASVGLSFVSSVVGSFWGSLGTSTATFVEESGEALAGVAFLVAVLVGVAPQLVFRAAELRRAEDRRHVPESGAVPSLAGRC
jgi:hypothetical protein